MNFLAHFQLAWPDEGLLLGALEGDYHKGLVGPGLSADMARGVRLHRAIDAYTDSHNVVASLRTELPVALRRYAGILIDLSFDHYLSKHWAHYCDLPLTQFNTSVYRILQERQHEFSEGARTMSTRLIEYDILGCYGEWDSVPASAARVGQRLRRGNPFLDIDSQLAPVRPALESAFTEFYPQLRQFVEDKRDSLD
ncbi:MAG: ACP phosphodiesterase [Pseudomonadota bacterium]